MERYTIPKRQWSSSVEGNRHSVESTRDELDIFDIVRESCLDQHSVPRYWKVRTTTLVRNSDWLVRFQEKRQELKDELNNGDTNVCYAFGLVRKDTLADIVCEYAAFGVHELYIPLGDLDKGVNLSLHADVLMSWARKKQFCNPSLIIYKILKGRVKVMKTLLTTDGGRYEPTPQHECHVMREKVDDPYSTDDLEDRMTNSQIFVYEYDAECLPSSHPRHCLPYAVICFQRDLSLASETRKQRDSATANLWLEHVVKNPKLDTLLKSVDLSDEDADEATFSIIEGKHANVSKEHVNKNSNCLLDNDSSFGGIVSFEGAAVFHKNCDQKTAPTSDTSSSEMSEKEFCGTVSKSKQMSSKLEQGEPINTEEKDAFGSKVIHKTGNNLDSSRASGITCQTSAKIVASMAASNLVFHGSYKHRNSITSPPMSDEESTNECEHYERIPFSNYSSNKGSGNNIVPSSLDNDSNISFDDKIVESQSEIMNSESSVYSEISSSEDSDNNVTDFPNQSTNDRHTFKSFDSTSVEGSEGGLSEEQLHIEIANESEQEPSPISDRFVVGDTSDHVDGDTMHCNKFVCEDESYVGSDEDNSVSVYSDNSLSDKEPYGKPCGPGVQIKSGNKPEQKQNCSTNSCTTDNTNTVSSNDEEIVKNCTTAKSESAIAEGKHSLINSSDSDEAVVSLAVGSGTLFKNTNTPVVVERKNRLKRRKKMILTNTSDDSSEEDTFRAKYTRLAAHKRNRNNKTKESTTPLCMAYPKGELINQSLAGDSVARKLIEEDILVYPSMPEHSSVQSLDAGIVSKDDAIPQHTYSSAALFPDNENHCGTKIRTLSDTGTELNLNNLYTRAPCVSINNQASASEKNESSDHALPKHAKNISQNNIIFESTTYKCIRAENSIEQQLRDNIRKLQKYKVMNCGARITEPCIDAEEVHKQNIAILNRYPNKLVSSDLDRNALGSDCTKQKSETSSNSTLLRKAELPENSITLSNVHTSISDPSYLISDSTSTINGSALNIPFESIDNDSSSPKGSKRTSDDTHRTNASTHGALNVHVSVSESGHQLDCTTKKNDSPKNNPSKALGNEQFNTESGSESSLENSCESDDICLASEVPDEGYMSPLTDDDDMDNDIAIEVPRKPDIVPSLLDTKLKDSIELNCKPQNSLQRLDARKVPKRDRSRRPTSDRGHGRCRGPWINTREYYSQTKDDTNYEKYRSFRSNSLKFDDYHQRHRHHSENEFSNNSKYDNNHVLNGRRISEEHTRTDTRAHQPNSLYNSTIGRSYNDSDVGMKYPETFAPQLRSEPLSSQSMTMNQALNQYGGIHLGGSGSNFEQPIYTPDVGTYNVKRASMMLDETQPVKPQLSFDNYQVVDMDLETTDMEIDIDVDSRESLAKSTEVDYENGKTTVASSLSRRNDLPISGHRPIIASDLQINEHTTSQNRSMVEGIRCLQLEMKCSTDAAIRAALQLSINRLKSRFASRPELTSLSAPGPTNNIASNTLQNSLKPELNRIPALTRQSAQCKELILRKVPAGIPIMVDPALSDDKRPTDPRPLRSKLFKKLCNVDLKALKYKRDFYTPKSNEFNVSGNIMNKQNQTIAFQASALPSAQSVHLTNGTVPMNANNIKTLDTLEKNPSDCQYSIDEARQRDRIAKVDMPCSDQDAGDAHIKPDVYKNSVITTTEHKCNSFVPQEIKANNTDDGNSKTSGPLKKISSDRHYSIDEEHNDKMTIVDMSCSNQDAGDATSQQEVYRDHFITATDHKSNSVQKLNLKPDVTQPPVNPSEQSVYLKNGIVPQQINTKKNNDVIFRTTICSIDQKKSAEAVTVVGISAKSNVSVKTPISFTFKMSKAKKTLKDQNTLRGSLKQYRQNKRKANEKSDEREPTSTCTATGKKHVSQTKTCVAQTAVRTSEQSVHLKNGTVLQQINASNNIDVMQTQISPICQKEPATVSRVSAKSNTSRKIKTKSSNFNISKARKTSNDRKTLGAMKKIPSDLRLLIKERKRARIASVIVSCNNQAAGDASIRPDVKKNRCNSVEKSDSKGKKRKFDDIQRTKNKRAATQSNKDDTSRRVASTLGDFSHSLQIDNQYGHKDGSHKDGHKYAKSHDRQDAIQYGHQGLASNQHGRQRGRKATNQITTHRKCSSKHERKYTNQHGGKDLNQQGRQHINQYKRQYFNTNVRKCRNHRDQLYVDQIGRIPAEHNGPRDPYEQVHPRFNQYAYTNKHFNFRPGSERLMYGNRNGMCHQDRW